MGNRWGAYTNTTAIGDNSPGLTLEAIRKAKTQMGKVLKSVTTEQLQKATSIAESQHGGIVTRYSLGVDEMLIYVGFYLTGWPHPRMYLLAGGHTWIYMHDYWPYDTVWVQTQDVTDGQ